MLCVTVLLFPLLYLTLELPKQIINGAIGSETDEISAFGMTFSKIEYLLVLCGFFLLAVLAHGLTKMRINTMKGVLAERLLRRFRFTLIARMLRFPKPYFERTSQGELVSMVTAESEPMGGLMGDALAQPVLQAGQMLTILGFLFAQSFAFGLAACALIPLQAWLIPKLQRQINKLNRKRVIQVRALAAEIGEGAAGASTLRMHAGWRRQLAVVTDRLGRLFAIRFEIYRKKFFMKFLNNFITQLTPFLFYSIGGYLVITGQVTLGALVAGLAAYKDLAAPWKELLAFYNQSQDMSLRWETITERFAPSGMLDERLISEEPAEVPRLTHDVVLDHVSLRDADGNTVLDSIDMTLPAGALVEIIAPRDEDRQAFAGIIAREVLPSGGKVQIGEAGLNDLHQITVASRIGHADSRPVLFQGSYGDNVLMPIRFRPMEEGSDPDFLFEAERSGNSSDMLSADWVDPGRGQVDSKDALRDRWCGLVEQIGGAQAMLRRAMDQVIDPELQSELIDTLVSLRPQVAKALELRNLDLHIHRLSPDTYCAALPVVQNLLFATPRAPLPPDALAERPDDFAMLRGLGLEEDLTELALGIMDGLRQIFGSGGTDHPLFQKTGLDPEHYEEVLSIVEDLRAGKELDPRAQALLLSVPSSIAAEQVGLVLPDRIRDRVLELRAEFGASLRENMSDMFAPITEDAPLLGMSVLENVLFGKISADAGPRAEDVRQAVIQVLREAQVTRQVLQLVFDVPVSLGGANLPATFAEPLAVSRAVIKHPDVLVLDQPMASFDPETHAQMLRALREDLPDATVIYLSSAPVEDVEFDLSFEIEQGRLTGTTASEEDDLADDVSADLARKLSALEQTSLFSGLDRKQLRLLAFGARWYRAQRKQYVFYKNDPPESGAFVMIEGEADLFLPQPEGGEKLIATVGPGAIVGELGLIRNEPRALDMQAKTDILCLRLGVEEFLAVVEHDAATSFKLLQVVAGYVST